MTQHNAHALTHLPHTPARSTMHNELAKHQRTDPAFTAARRPACQRRGDTDQTAVAGSGRATMLGASETGKQRRKTDRERADVPHEILVWMSACACIAKARLRPSDTRRSANGITKSGAACRPSSPRLVLVVCIDSFVALVFEFFCSFIAFLARAIAVADVYAEFAVVGADAGAVNVPEGLQLSSLHRA